jgi:hypothetical protein
LGFGTENKGIAKTPCDVITTEILHSMAANNEQIARYECTYTYHESIRAFRLGLDGGVDNTLNLFLDAMGLEILLGSLQIRYRNMSRS